MDWIAPRIEYYFIVPMLLYYYYGRMLAMPYRWYRGFFYTALYYGLAVCEAKGYLTGFIYVFLQIILMALFGSALLKRKDAAAVVVSAIVISAGSIIEGIAQSVSFWMIRYISDQSAIILKYVDTGRGLFVVILIIAVFRVFIKTCADSIAGTRRTGLLVLGIPVLFIALAEKNVSDAIYGDTVVWHSTKGLIEPAVNDMELLILRAFALAGLFCALLAHQKLMDMIRHEQTIKLLEQQAQNQESYVREAQSRYEQTKSFRHDVNNHLLVLRRLLSENKPAEAGLYLSNLEQISDSLSYPVNTGNTIIDALLGSKLAAAAGRGIPVECIIAIPPKSRVRDIDWCIILSNALDNAITAGEAFLDNGGYIRISGSQKGNFYLLVIENACASNTELPTAGTGLSNIKAIAKKNGGKAEIDIAGGVFKLSVLLAL